MSEEIKNLAKLLDIARLESQPIESLTKTYPHLTLSNGYLIQDVGVAFRLSQGEKCIGFKMGLTSQAKREQMNLDSPIYGILTDKMEIKDRDQFSLERSIHPKIEPEIAFIIGREVRGVLSMQEAFESCSGVTAALEILDSRFLNFKYFSLPDVVADNCSSAYFVLSQNITRLNDVDLSNLEMVMSVDGNPIQRAVSSSISGHPIQSVVQLSQMLSNRGLSLPAGSIVLAGAATQAIPLKRGSSVSLKVETLGDVSIFVK